MRLLDEIYTKEILMESKVDKALKMFERYPLLIRDYGVPDKVQRAVNILKKDNRIAYYLNWYRYYMLKTFLVDLGFVYCIEPSETYTSEEIKLEKAGLLSNETTPYYEGYFKEEQALAKRSNKSIDIIKSEVYQLRPVRFLETVAPILELPYPDIQSDEPWVFDNLPSDVLIKLQATYEKYKEQTYCTFTPDPTEEIVLKFDDGWAWFDLHANMTKGGKHRVPGGPPNEAECLQHCGNDYDRHSIQGGMPNDLYRHEDDRVYLLREPVQALKGLNRWRSYITAVVNNGTLIEMKGKQNDKPHPKYHEYIIPFIKLDIIKKIDASWSHQPEKSFSLNDVSPAIKTEILQLKGEDFENNEDNKLKAAIEEAIEKLDNLTENARDTLKHSFITYQQDEEDNSVFTYSININFNLSRLDLLVELDTLPYAQNREISKFVMELIDIDIGVVDDYNIMENEIVFYISPIPESVDNIVRKYKQKLRQLREFEETEYDEVFTKLTGFLIKKGYVKAKKYQEILNDIQNKIDEDEHIEIKHDTVTMDFVLYTREQITLTMLDRIKDYFATNTTFDEIISQGASLEYEKHPEFKFEESIKYGHIFNTVRAERISSSSSYGYSIYLYFPIENIKNFNDNELKDLVKVIEYFGKNYQELQKVLIDIVSNVTGLLFMRKGYRADKEYTFAREVPIANVPEEYRNWYFKQLRKRFEQRHQV